MIDLYTALKLCNKEEYIRIYDTDYTHKQIIEKYDLRKTKVKNIYFDRWHDIIRFELSQ